MAHVSRAFLCAITGVTMAVIPACSPEPPAANPEAPPGNEDRVASSPGSSPEAARHIDQIRSAFRISPRARPTVPVFGDPASASRDPASAPVLGDPIATGYERTAAGLQATGGASEVDVVLPASAGGARRLQINGVAISARLRGASPSPAELSGGYVLYRDTLGAGVSVVEQARADGVEDFVYFPQRPAAENLVYDLDLDAGVGGLRLVANTLEILDSAGVPRLRVNPPFAVAADGTVVDATLSVAGCAVDTSPAVPSAVRLAAGARSCQVALAWKGVTYPALVDPSWVSTATMAYARTFPASSLVIDNRHVLVTGGYDLTSGALATAEIYDASTGVWTATGSMTDRRYAHQQVALASGKILVTGGLDTTLPYVAASQEYDPSSGTWINRATMAVGRYDFPLVVVSGTPVALGGWAASGALAACEKYDTAAHTWSAFASMSTARGGAAAASNGAGAFIVAGGYNPAAGYLDSSELYSTAAGAFWAGATMTNKRAYHLANAVTGNPKVLVTGGLNATGNLKTAEVYYGTFVFPQPGSWSAILGMSVARHRHQAINLSPSRVMVCGGLDEFSADNKTCETFDTFPFTWSTDCEMTTARHSFTMLLVPSVARALAAGGYMFSSAELSCHHDRCTSGVPLWTSAGGCVSSVCAADPFCCTTAWDATCIAEVRTVCGSLICPESNGSCTHSLCTAGGSLVTPCDSAKANCVAAVCAVDSFCCTTAWDSLCVSRVASTCGKTCN